MERALPFCLHSPSFIAHTAGSGSDAVLPTQHAHDGDGNPHSGWLQGPWMPFPSSSECLPQCLQVLLPGEWILSAEGQRQDQQWHEDLPTELDCSLVLTSCLQAVDCA